MNTIQKISYWGDVHHPAWLDIGRIILGAILFYKGVPFGSHPHDLKRYIDDGGLFSMFLLHYIPMIHFVGGVLIVIGLITRTAVIFQLPVLIGAVILAHRDTGMFNFYSDIAMAWTVLVMLVIFLIYGSGPFSVDQYMKKYKGG